MGSIRNPRDFWAGLLFIGIGVFAIAVGTNYQLGSAARMGPGYFPRILGILLLILGTLITVNTKIRNKGGKLCLANIDPQIYEVFVITRLNKLFSIHPDTKSAKASFE